MLRRRLTTAPDEGAAPVLIALRHPADVRQFVEMILVHRLQNEFIVRIGIDDNHRVRFPESVAETEKKRMTFVRGVERARFEDPGVIESEIHRTRCFVLDDSFEFVMESHLTSPTDVGGDFSHSGERSILFNVSDVVVLSERHHLTETNSETDRRISGNVGIVHIFEDRAFPRFSVVRYRHRFLR